LLGNRALSTVDEAKQLCAAPIPAATDSADDAATIDLLRRGDTLGVVQLESPAMRNLLIQLQADGLEDVIQSLALLRPGAASIGMKDRFIRRRRGLEESPSPPSPLCHEGEVCLAATRIGSLRFASRLNSPFVEEGEGGVLDDTHGLMLYEDDA